MLRVRSDAARGAEQARLIADEIAARLPSRSGVRLFSSDLRRTRRTAVAIGVRLGVDPVLDPSLREQSYGAAEGLPVGTVTFAPAPASGDWLRHHDGVDGSETRLDVATRIYAAVDRVIASGAVNAVIVTHAAAAMAAWIGMPLESVGAVKFTVVPGSISVLREDSSSDRRVVSLNETRYLD